MIPEIVGWGLYLVVGAPGLSTPYIVKVVVSYVYKGMEGYGSYECNHIYGRVENMVGAVGICSTNTYRNSGHWKAPRPKS
jgi:hypothetical protein